MAVKDVYKVGYDLTIFKTQRTYRFYVPIVARDVYDARQQAKQTLEQENKSHGTVKIISVKKHDSRKEKQIIFKAR